MLCTVLGKQDMFNVSGTSEWHPRAALALRNAIVEAGASSIRAGQGHLNISLVSRDRVKGFERVENSGVAGTQRYGGVPFHHGFSAVNAAIR